MFKLREIAAKINIKGRILLDEPMAGHTTFKTGGPADIFALPESPEDVEILFDFARREGLDYFVLGGGANILAADAGFRGLIIATEKLTEYRLDLDAESLWALSGGALSSLAEAAGENGLGGLQYFYAMPGSLGGAVWMNARCYDHSICESLKSVDYLHPDGTLTTEEIRLEDFAYKVSPYQQKKGLILGAEFALHREDPKKLREEMKAYEEDRRGKGHFRAPSAGSVFKNNRDFGKPSGRIIDEAGLKGLRIGGAQVSPDHGNIIYNVDRAASADIRELIQRVKEEVQKKFGFPLEEEIIYFGDWRRH